MDTNSASAPAASATMDAPAMNFVQRLVGIYFEPRKTFEDVGRKGSWLGMFLIIAFLSVAASYTVTTRMDYETYMRKAMQMNPLTRNMPEEQVQRILSQPPNPFQRYSGTIFAPVGVMIVYLVLAGAFLLIFVLMGASISYKKSLAVTVWALGAPGIIHLMLSIIFLILKDPDALDLNVTNNVVSNFGPLVTEKEHPVIQSFLGSLDLFSFWAISLLAVGFSTISDRKLTTGKAATGILILWGLYVLGKLGLTALMS